MRAAREEYERLELAWESALAKAHRQEGNPAQIRETMEKANQLGPKVLAALARDQKAVKDVLDDSETRFQEGD